MAGVKDMRFQALMPDILHWLGITKIDRMMSMSEYANSNEYISSCKALTLTQHEARRNRWARVHISPSIVVPCLHDL